jgi:hypothetical protein
MSFDDLMRHRREFARAIENRDFVERPDGILFPKQGLFIGGMFESWVNGRDHQVDKNIIPTEGLNYLLDVAVKNGSPIHPWYVGLFSGNYTPVIGVTAATWVAAATEFTSYDEPTREEYVEGAIASGSVSNSASKADFTMSTGVSAQVLYGAALVQASAKSAGTGKILAISRFAASRTVNETDVLSVQYTLTIAN